MSIDTTIIVSVLLGLAAGIMIGVIVFQPPRQKDCIEKFMEKQE